MQGRKDLKERKEIPDPKARPVCKDGKVNQVLAQEVILVLRGQKEIKEKQDQEDQMVYQGTWDSLAVQEKKEPLGRRENQGSKGEKERRDHLHL